MYLKELNDELKKYERFLSLEKLLGYQNQPNDEECDNLDIIHNLYENSNIIWILVKAFTYGKIQGIRSERSKRRRMN